MKNASISNWMTQEVVSVTPETHLPDARKMMTVRRIRTLPVMQGDELIGIVTRRGLLRADMSPLSRQTDPLQGKRQVPVIRDVMTRGVISIPPQATLRKAASLMLENKIGGLPVMQAGQLKGILTTSDMFRVIIDELRESKTDIRVHAYMTVDVETIPSCTTLIEAQRIMAVKRFRALPVVDGEELVGIITRTDVLSADPSKLYLRGLVDLEWEICNSTIERIMTKPVITIRENAPIIEAARLMLDNKFHSLPVVDAGGKLAGILTDTDLLTLVVRKFF